jgi:NAD(P)-dependent dehydrogenase (short-subunit alcohol dehydrogenase family)
VAPHARPVVVVTGASRGLGAEIARSAAGRGFDLVLVGRDRDRLDSVRRDCEGRGGEIETIAADVRHPETAPLVVHRTNERFGRVDGLVNNAGIYRTAPADAVDEALWDDVIATNLTAPYRLSSYVGREMIAAGRGSIVNIASVFALVGVPRTAAYAASKGGLISMTRTLAVEWAPHGVRVNAVAAGHIRTELTAAELETEAVQRYIQRNVPLGRVAEPGEIVPLVCLLLGDDASFITGAVYEADGGFTAR